MRIDKTKNAKKSILFGMINKMITLLLPFVIQTILIKRFGVIYVGLKGVFTSILSVLCLSELGIGTAIVFCMYKPIVEDDSAGISALLNLYKLLYRRISFVILFLGILIVPFLKYIIKDDVPSDVNIYIIFGVFLLNSIFSYLIKAYKSSLLMAYQRTDVISIVGIVVNLITFILQILALRCFKNYYVYLLIMVLGTVANNMVISFVVSYMFPNIKCEGTVSDEAIDTIKEKVKGVVLNKLCYMSRNSFDALFVTRFLGLGITAIYSNYMYIFLAVGSLIEVLLSSLTAGIGNGLIIDSKKKNLDDMLKLNNIYMLIAGWMTICLVCLYQPFVKMWVGSDNMFSNHTMLLLGLYFLALRKGDIRSVYSDAAGLFWENRKRKLFEAIGNIVLNGLLVIIFGIDGIIMATIITVYIGHYWGTAILFRHYFKDGIWKYILNQFVNTLGVIAGVLLFYFICEKVFPDYNLYTLLERAIVVIVTPPILYCLVTFKTKRFSKDKEWIINILWKDK